MQNEIKVLFEKEKIDRRISELATQIDQHANGAQLTVIGVLKGAFVFMSDLVRMIKSPLKCDFLRVSSYKNDKSTGTIRMELDITQPIVGENVLLVEDIVDTGITLRHLLDHLKTKGPKSLKVASLLYKETGNDMRKFVDYVGFEVPNKYVIGYGLDSEGLYRSLPYIGYFEK